MLLSVLTFNHYDVMGVKVLRYQEHMACSYIFIQNTTVTIAHFLMYFLYLVPTLHHKDKITVVVIINKVACFCCFETESSKQSLAVQLRTFVTQTY